MIDHEAIHAAIPFERNFRWRGREISRIEAFSDAIFAVAIALSIVSFEVPRSYGELMAVVRAFPAFAATFVMLVMIWFFHYIHFRRYGIQDFKTVMLNSLLLFLVLFYVYPLKFMSSFLIEWTRSSMLEAARAFSLNQSTVGTLLVVYGVGFVAVFSLLALLTRHAYAKREALGLNEVEVAMTRSLQRTHLIQVAVGALSVSMALLMPDPYKGFAGWAYVLLGPAHMIHARKATREEQAILVGEPTEETAD